MWLYETGYYYPSDVKTVQVGRVILLFFSIWICFLNEKCMHGVFMSLYYKYKVETTVKPILK